MFLAAALAGGALAVAGHRAELVAALHRLSWWAVGAALLAGWAAGFCSMLTWRALLGDLGSPLPVRTAGRVLFLGQLGKYVPGSVWSVVAQVELAREHHVPRKRSVAVGLTGIGLAVVIGGIMAAVLLPFGSPGAMRRYWWLFLAVPVLLAAMHPAVLSAAFDRLLRLLRREPLGERLSYRGLLRAVGWQTAAWLWYGLHAYALVVGMGGPAGKSLVLAVGAFVLAYSVGVVLVPVPAGAGVREAAFVLALSPVLATAPALAVALVSRVLLTVCDFTLAGLAVLAARRRSGATLVVPDSEGAVSR